MKLKKEKSKKNKGEIMSKPITYVITVYDYEMGVENATDGYINVYETNGNCTNQMLYENFEIKQELPETDNEDFNDIARWLAKTILAAKKLEHEDEFAHCDWSAEDKYEFTVKITKKENKND